MTLLHAVYWNLLDKWKTLMKAKGVLVKGHIFCEWLRHQYASSLPSPAQKKKYFFHLQFNLFTFTTYNSKGLTFLLVCFISSNQEITFLAHCDDTMFSSSLELGLSNSYHSFQWFLRCFDGLPCLLLGHEVFCSDLAINDFTVLLSRQHLRDVLMFSMLIVVVFIVVGSEEVKTEGALRQTGCPSVSC